MRTRAFVLGALLLSLGAAGPCLAQAWVSKMISETEHDFGTVARGADTVYKFPIKNIYKQDIQLTGVRSSCGCTSPSIENKVVKTGETGYIVASFNTRTFTGPHSATLTFTAEWDDNGVRRRGEGQVRVHGNIRSDVVFTPGAVKFEAVDQGSKSEQQVRVTYAGRSDWKITDVRGASEDIEVELTETQRMQGRVAYDLLVRMKDSAPAGYFNEQLVLVTSDGQNPRIPLHVQGRVVPEISVAPESLVFGDVAPGQLVPKKIIVRGKKPFKIVSVNSDADCFQFKTDGKTSDRHVVEVVFAPKNDAGKVKETIHIATDLGDTYEASLTAYATVIPETSQAMPTDESGDMAKAPGGSGSTSASNGVKTVAAQ